MRSREEIEKESNRISLTCATFDRGSVYGNKLILEVCLDIRDLLIEQKKEPKEECLMPNIADLSKRAIYESYKKKGSRKSVPTTRSKR